MDTGIKACHSMDYVLAFLLLTLKRYLSTELRPLRKRERNLVNKENKMIIITRIYGKLVYLNRQKIFLKYVSSDVFYERYNMFLDMLTKEEDLF